jgi:mRNA interferase RelE/StbE
VKVRRVTITHAAARDLRRLPEDIARALLVAIDAYVGGRMPNADVRKLRGRSHEWRLRVGSYRVLFEADGVLTVLRVLDRKDVYRKR